MNRKIQPEGRGTVLKTSFIFLRARGLNGYRNYVPIGGAIFGPAETGAHD